MRRHRLHGIELGPVKRAVEAQLSELLNNRENELEAEILFRILYRFNHPYTGKPRYPPFSWATVKATLQPNRMVPLARAINARALEAVS